jgi:hypothetical protein
MTMSYCYRSGSGEYVQHLTADKVRTLCEIDLLAQPAFAKWKITDKVLPGINLCKTCRDKRDGVKPPVKAESVRTWWVQP